jgi:uncharacterized membrane protein
MMEQHWEYYGTPIYFLDVFALLFYMAAWFGYAAYAQWQYPRTPNLISITGKMRVQWMRQMLARENRMVDASLMGNLLRSITFFASTSTFILVGLISMMGYKDKAEGIIQTIPFAIPTTGFMWEFKVFMMIFIFVYSFFKYTWSVRLYNYANMYVGAAPLSRDYRGREEEFERYAQRGGLLIANAGRHFNMGLRAYYYGLAVLSWFIHPLVFILLTAWVVYEVHRREFRSETVNGLADIETVNVDAIL